jgi:hypothetical protein
VVEHHHAHEPRPRFDPQAALEELERFGRDIQRYRAQREALGDQFETFVQSFKHPPDAFPVNQEETVAPAVTAAAAIETPVFETPATELSPPAMAAPPQVTTFSDTSPEREPAASPQAILTPTPRARSGMSPVIAAAAAILVGGGLLAAFIWNGAGQSASESTAREPAAASAPAPAPSPTAPEATASSAAAAPRVTAAASAGESAIVVERQVWMRVIVDGARVLEREVPAGTTIPLKAEKTIVIRTGDAGAVRLSLRGGTATALGSEGEVVTRSFTVPPRGEAGR